MAEWNGPDEPLVFNDSIIVSSDGSPEYAVVLTESGIDTIARPFRGTARWFIDFQGMTLNEKQYEELLRIMRFTKMQLEPLLVRNVRNCTMENSEGAPADLGESDGASGTFQLFKSHSLQNRGPELEIVRYPCYGYPKHRDLSDKDWEALPELQIWQGPAGATSTDDLTERTALSGLVVDRLTGEIALTPAPDDGLHIYATGGFLTLMRFTVNSLPAKCTGGYFEVTGSGGLIEEIVREAA